MQTIKDIMDTAKELWRDFLWMNRTRDPMILKNSVTKKLIEYQLDMVAIIKERNASTEEFLDKLKNKPSLGCIYENAKKNQEHDFKIVAVLKKQIHLVQKVVKN